MTSSAARPRAYSYIRMSSELQLKGDSLRRQLAGSASYAAAHGLELVDEFRLEDIGISAFKGANVTEGALGRFLDAAKSGKVPVGSFLLVESLDRLSRQEVRKSLSIFLSIIDAGINLVTLADNRVYTPKNTELVELVTSLVIMSRAHEESRTKSQRVAAAWANKRTNARSRPLTATCPAWLRLSGDRNCYEVIEDRAAVVRRIFEESAFGIGNYSITQRLNRQRIPHFGRSDGWHPSYVAKILKNRAAIGEFQPHRLVDGKREPVGDPIQNYFPAVIGEATFYRAQLGLSERRNRGAGRKGAFVSNLFSGIVVCAYCRSPMKFENKGLPPKGANFLVCDRTKRGLGCKTTRWRYDQFEASFLAFVREADLEQIVHSEDEAKKRSVLDSIVSALQGEQGAIKEQMEKTYELLMAGAATGFVAEKLKQLERRRSDVEAELREKEQERAQLGSATSEFYESRDQVKALIEQLQSRKGDEIYKLRSRIASKLRSLVTTILVAPVGAAPMTERAIDFLRNQPDSADIIDHLKKELQDERANRRYFIAVFNDNSMRAVYPSDDDPLQFQQQVVSSKEQGLIRVFPAGDEQVFPPRFTIDELFPEARTGKSGDA
jgi:DNA invertase Pin-like site-specific DNA recombinase